MNIAVIIASTITIILIALGFIFNKSKLILGIQFIWMWILIGLNNGGTDYDVYQGIFRTAYNFKIFGYTDSLFYSIYYLFKNSDKTLIFANSVMTIISLILIFSRTLKFTNKKGIVTSLMLVFPLIDNIIQKKNFYASSIVILSFSLLLNEKVKHRKILSLIMIIIASRIHSSALIYLIFWFLYMIPIEKIKKILPVLLTGAFISIPIIPKIASIFFHSAKIQLYFYTLKISAFDSICWMILHLVFTIIIIIFCKQPKSGLTDEQKKYEQNVYKLNLILLIMLPLYYYEPTFFRIYRNLMIFNYIVIANRQSKLTNKTSLFLTISWIAYIIATFLLTDVIIADAYRIKIVSSFTNNEFLNWLIGG